MPATRKLPIGYRVHDLTVVETGLRKPAMPNEAHRFPDGCKPAVRLECVCGRRLLLHTSDFLTGRRIGCKACGRARRVELHGRQWHGMSGHPLYSTWRQIRARCTNPRSSDYPDYGGKGVTLHAAWLNDPAAFLGYVDGLGERLEGQTLDRINPAGNYEPGNLRWATPLEQRHNRRAA